MSHSITPHQAKYFAYELTKRGASDSFDKFATTLADAQVDLNPHQVDAALFAFRSPLSKGAILADEVGLGKTIEAGIVISQKWAERKRKILVIAPATLRKQWSQELADKFFIPTFILEKKSFDAERKAKKRNPFNQNDVVICSYQFARSKEIEIEEIDWDLVIVDEAHRLRNVYKPTNKVGNAIKSAISRAPKILLTATPLQNSLLELYGLVSIIDDHVFGDLKSFKDMFVGAADEEDYKALKARLSTVCQRTLRKQVLEYINYTNRISLTQEFYPSEDEQRLYDLVSDYLQRETLYALPKSQRKLMTLILRKLLASSTYAIAGTLNALKSRLEALLAYQAEVDAPIDLGQISTDLETTDELVDEWDVEDEEESERNKILTPIQIEEVKHELELIKEFLKLAESIAKNSKGEVLLIALKKGFEKLQELGAEKKAVIFTESTRTQNYLLSVLQGSEYKDKIVLFNGSNSDPKSKEIYKKWLERHKGTDKISGSASADMRAALVEEFKENGQILVATEAAAEGINLQFCSLVSNFDLPWNPQRIEQRIGRCHRYGQKHDVVVLNFLNKANAADQRVFELLDQKFKLFSGVFGASDEVLGVLDAGIDFEKKIAEIYQKCRTPQQIEFEFNDLQEKLESDINSRMTDTKRKLLENFDDEVQEKLRVGKAKTEELLSRHEAWLWQITKFSLQNSATFSESENEFVLNSNPFPSLKINYGPYKLGKTINEANLYRIGHPLAQKVIEVCKETITEPALIIFNLSDSSKRITALEPLKGKEGYMVVQQIQVTTFEEEDHILVQASELSGSNIDSDLATKMLTLPGTLQPITNFQIPNELEEALQQKVTEKLKEVDRRNSSFFDEEMLKLDRWADDKRNSLKAALDECDDEIKDLKKQARDAGSVPVKLEIQKKIRASEVRRDSAWREYDTAAKEIDKQKEELIDSLEKRLNQTMESNDILKIKWKVV